MKLKLLLVLFIFLLVSSAFAQKPIRDIEESLILISIDGFRDDYLDVHKPKTLRKLARNGSRPTYLIPSYPTKTFPNHYTIATGLYPSNHGIVANNIFDKLTKRRFSLRNREEVQSPFWWGGEPIWVSAEKAGIKTGAFFFPGTETKIKGVSPSIWQNYDGKIPNEVRVDSVLSWFDREKENRPRFMTLYFSDVDDAGHRYSPISKETRASVRHVDKMIKRLIEGLKARRIDKKVNLIIVSDHGMADAPGKNYFLTDELFDENDAEKVLWVGELTQIYPKDGREDKIYNSLKKGLPETFQVYLKNEIPEQFKYREHPRIAPILIVPDPGWYVLNTETLKRYREQGRIENLGGRHGYDHLHKTMRALFIGHGPAFKRGHVTQPFQNTEIYNLMCKILGISPAPNDGKLENVIELLR